MNERAIEAIWLNQIDTLSFLLDNFEIPNEILCQVSPSQHELFELALSKGLKPTSDIVLDCIEIGAFERLVRLTPPELLDFAFPLVIEHGTLSDLEALLNHGSKPASTDLEVAIRLNKLQVLKLLLKFAKPNKSTLIEAIKAGSFKMSKLLLRQVKPDSEIIELASTQNSKIHELMIGLRA